MTQGDGSRETDIQLPGTHRELHVLRGRYETASIVNDLLIAIWFLVGSLLFFREATTYAGTWLFVIGSAQLAIRPSIRLSRRLHLRHRAGEDRDRRVHESDDDF